MAIFVNGTVGGDSNIIETVKVNNTALPVSNKAVNVDLTNLAPKASPALTGTPTAPTAASGTNTTQIATTAFVQSAVNDSKDYVIFNEFSSYDSVYSELGSGKQLLFDSGNIDVITGYGMDNHDSIYLSYISTQVIDGVENDELASADYELRVGYHKVDTSDNWTTETNSDDFAHLLSPNFTGIPTAPTAASGTNTTQIATTAFVQDAISSGTQQITDCIITQRDIADNNYICLTSGNNWYVSSSTIVDSDNYPDLFDFYTSDSIDNYIDMESDTSVWYYSGMQYIDGYYVFFSNKSNRLYYSQNPTKNFSYITISSFTINTSVASQSYIKKVNNYYIILGGYGGNIAYSTSLLGTWTVKSLISSSSSAKIINDIVKYGSYWVATVQHYTGSSSSTSTTSYVYSTTLSGTWTQVDLFSYATLVGSYSSLAVINSKLYLLAQYSGNALRLYVINNIDGTDATYTTYSNSYYHGKFFEFNGDFYVGITGKSGAVNTRLLRITSTGTVTSYTIANVDTYSDCVWDIAYINNMFYLVMGKYNGSILAGYIFRTSDLTSSSSTWEKISIGSWTNLSQYGFVISSNYPPAYIGFYNSSSSGSTRYLRAYYSTGFPDTVPSNYAEAPKIPGDPFGITSSSKFKVYMKATY